MAITYQLLINWGSRSGFSEEFTFESPTTPSPGSQTDVVATALGNARAGCLTRAARIVGCRVFDPFLPRVVRPVRLDLPGVLGSSISPLGNTGPDPATTARLIRFTASNGSTRNYLMRGLPDGDVQDGRFTAAASGHGPYESFLNLVGGPTSRILSNSLTLLGDFGSITGSTGFLSGPLGVVYTANQLILVKTRVAGHGCRIYWIGRTASGGTGNAVLRGWHRGNTEGGQVFAVSRVLVSVSTRTSPVPDYTRTRATGKPFFLPRGRRASSC